MLCVEDALDGLVWAESIGGLPGLIARSEANLAAVRDWIGDGSRWHFLARTAPASVSPTSICIAPHGAEPALIKRIAALLEAEGVALDIAGYRDAPPSFRIWGGGTVETTDIAALLPWLDWALGR